MMGIFDEIAEDIKNKLSADKELSEVGFINSYRVAKQPNPIRSSYVTIGISEVDSSDRAFGNYFGQSCGEDVFGKNCSITVLLRINSPKFLGSNNCSDIFSKIFDCLFLDPDLKQIYRINCKEVGFDKSSEVYFLDCLLKMRLFIGKSNEEIEISDIQVKGEI